MPLYDNVYFWLYFMEIICIILYSVIFNEGYYDLQSKELNLQSKVVEIQRICKSK